jgi:hypothetical protein
VMNCKHPSDVIVNFDGGEEMIYWCSVCGSVQPEGGEWQAPKYVSAIYCIEQHHLDRLKTIATRMRDASEKRLPVGAERMGAGEMLDAAHDIFTAVRYAESLHALRGPGEPYVHVTPREP